MSEIRVCKICEKEKPLAEFIQSRGIKQRRCKECIYARGTQYKQKNKLKAIAYKGGKCVDCGYVGNPAVYEFHHLDESGKDREPNQLMGCKWENITKEIDKCVLLCANCHRIRHHENEK